MLMLLQGALKAKIHETKQLRQATSDKRDHDQFTLLNVKAEISKLQGLVVRSPERAKRDIVDMSRQLEGDKDTLVEMDEKLQVRTLYMYSMCTSAYNIHQCSSCEGSISFTMFFFVAWLRDPGGSCARLLSSRPTPPVMVKRNLGGEVIIHKCPDICSVLAY
jgi:hypothetical protein